jgi:hypothetical protein
MSLDRMRARGASDAEVPAGDAMAAAPGSGACVAPAERASTGVRHSAWRKAPPSMPIVVYKSSSARRTPALLPMLAALDEFAYGPLACERLRQHAERLGIDTETARMVHALVRKLAGDALRRDLRADASTAPLCRHAVLGAWTTGLDEAVSQCERLVAAGLSPSDIRAGLAESFRHDRAQRTAPTPPCNAR